MADKRDPQAIGEALKNLKELYPNKSAPERADLLEKMWVIPNLNGKK